MTVLKYPYGLTVNSTTLFEISSGAWFAIWNIKLIEVDDIALYPRLAALVAITEQVVTLKAIKSLSLIEQLEPVTLKVTAPVPEPPLVVRIT
jgi:hypothetical protein